ncbi:hypothetical protein Goshw_003467, partial [Gossypium schwendimanii]|nr:hypothetical protein [Gossypium schwendimanii]
MKDIFVVGISFQQLLQVEGWRREPVLCTHDEDCKDYCKGLYRCIKGCCNCFDEMQVQQQQQHVNGAIPVSSCMSFQQVLKVEGWREIPVLCTHDEQCKQYCKGEYRCINGSCNCADEMQVQQHVNEAAPVSSYVSAHSPT